MPPALAETAPAWTTHGGRLAAARAAFGGTAADWLDLSTGIAPHSWPGAATAAAMVDWRTLPEPEALAGLEAAAAAHFGCAPATCVAVPGSEIALRLLGALIGGEAAHVAPGYATHAEAFAGSVAIARDAVEAAARGGRTVVLANPGNPDGHRQPVARLLAVARAMRGGGGRLIVDEAFADAVAGPWLSAHVDDETPLVVLRSFGKFFGLAGVRLGFVVGPRAIVDACRARLGSWPVSAAAIAIGTPAYRDAAWIAAARTRLATDAAALDAVLARHGLAADGECPLFRLVATPDAAALFARLARRRILTRPFAGHRDRLRIGLPGDAAALARLDAALG